MRSASRSYAANARMHLRQSTSCYRICLRLQITRKDGLWRRQFRSGAETSLRSKRREAPCSLGHAELIEQPSRALGHHRLNQNADLPRALGGDIENRRHALRVRLLVRPRLLAGEIA